MTSSIAEIREEFKKVLDKYGVTLVCLIFNCNDTVDIELDHNIYYKSQEDMINELNEIYPVGYVDFMEVE
jgi:hypothetical protein